MVSLPFIYFYKCFLLLLNFHPELISLSQLYLYFILDFIGFTLLSIVRIYYLHNHQYLEFLLQPYRNLLNSNWMVKFCRFREFIHIDHK